MKLARSVALVLAAASAVLVGGGCSDDQEISDAAASSPDLTKHVDLRTTSDDIARLDLAAPPDQRETPDVGLSRFDLRRECESDVDCLDPQRPHCSLQLGGFCAECAIDDHCAAGSVCRGVACQPGCTMQHACDGGRACCADTCIDTRADTGNCGACGVACKPGESCCTGACADLASNASHCGACGAACTFPNATGACANKVCGLGVCKAGFADCDRQAGNGCEVAVAGDLANCGACGVRCTVPHASPGCFGGVCQVAACDPGFRDCNHLPADGCEIDAFNDNLNCGICGAVCKQLPHASAVCVMGGCAVTLCDAGYGNCDKQDANGCESTLASDVQNCGGCGMKCPTPPNNSATCVNAKCGVGACLMGFADCDGNGGNGCEAALASDAANCGGCGKACQPGAACVGGMCSVLYGSGRDGALVVNGATTFGGYRETHLSAAANPGDTTLAVVDSTGFMAGDKVLVLNVRSPMGNEGRWEVADVLSVAQGSLKLAAALVSAYPEAQNTVVRALPQYTTVSVANGGVLSPGPWDPVALAGGVIAFIANVSVTIDGSISANGVGYRGGIGNNSDPNQTTFKSQGESYPGVGGSGLAQNVPNGGGGGGGSKRFGCEGGGGGGGGHAGDGFAGGNHQVCAMPGGVGGSMHGDAQLTRIFLGSGGGSGGYTVDPLKGAGGAGGGIIIIYSPKVTVNGVIESNGADGTAEYGDYGGGGGGAGGSVYIRTAQNVTGGANVRANGGSGGAANGRSEVGGPGNVGRVKLDVRP